MNDEMLKAAEDNLCNHIGHLIDTVGEDITLLWVTAHFQALIEFNLQDTDADVDGELLLQGDRRDITLHAVK